MNTWKEYRRNDIKKHRGLRVVNQSPERKFKYGEPLTIDMTQEEVVQKLKSETTQTSPEAYNIL
jgi:hypothetical protein